MNKSITEYGAHNLGLFVFDPPDPMWRMKHGPPNLDVIAVHGLNGDCRRTWTYVDPETKEETMWLKDMLPLKMPRIRAMTFGYNATVLAGTTVSGVRDNAKSLLMALRNLRQGDRSEGRPIVFVGHSLGGIIIKQALCIANLDQQRFGDILNSTRGIVFFGTPHRGTDAAVWGEMLARIKGASFGKFGLSSYIRILRPNHKDLIALSEDFRPVAPRFALSSFNEENPYPGSSKVIVDKFSAHMEMPHEDHQALPGDHSSIVRFSPKPSDQHRFSLVWNAIERVSKGPVTTMPSESRPVYHETPVSTGSHDGVSGWGDSERRHIRIDARMIEAPRGFRMDRIELQERSYEGQSAWRIGG